MTKSPKSQPKPKPRQDDPAQSRRFIDMAREVEADESPEALEQALRKIIRPPQKEEPGGGRE
jgi:hypothetical protein